MPYTILPRHRPQILPLAVVIVFMRKAKLLNVPCSVCGKIIDDRASHRKKSKSGKFFCSFKCRGIGVASSISIALGGDGVKRTKRQRDARQYRKNLTLRRKKQVSYYWKHRSRILADGKSRQRENKAKVVKAYGGKCVCCGVDYVELLTIDHVNGGGNSHRREAGQAKQIYKYLISQGFPKKQYRLLCFNCNISRGFYGYCPHMPEDRQKICKSWTNAGRKPTVCPVKQH